MSSGIKVDQLSKDIFEEMKLIKKGQTRKMAFFRIADDLQTVTSDDSPLEGKETSRDPNDDEKMFMMLKKILEESEHPLYVLYDFVFTSDSGGRVEKLALIGWCTDKYPVKKKMLFASTKETVQKALAVNKSLLFQVSDLDELNYEEMKLKVQRSK